MIFQLALIYFPALVFGFLFVKNYRKEPRQFRNALYFLLLCLFALYGLSIQFELPWLVLIGLAAIPFGTVALVVFLLANTFVVVKREGLSLSHLLPGLLALCIVMARLDKAVELWEADHRRAVIIASGGQGADEEVSEAEAMRTYLVEERGVPADAVIEENRSTTTMENLRNSKAIMDARSGAGAYRAAVVTSDYHVFRTAEYAHKIGLAADGVGSRTARYFWPTAFIREYVAVSNAHRWPFVVIFVFWLPFAAIALFQL